MNKKQTNLPQVPGGPTGDADDSRQVPRGARGQVNLRAGIFNYQTTQAMQLDPLNENYEYPSLSYSRSSRYNLRPKARRPSSTSSLGMETTQERVVTPTSPASSVNLFESPASSPNPLEKRNKRISSTSTSSLLGFEEVVQEAHAVNTVPTSNRTRVRKKWSTDMNEFIWRTYLIITHNETKTKVYLDQLHKQFIETFPDMDVSRQRIGDQRRAILRNKLLPETTLHKIRKEVQTYLNQNNHTNGDNDIITNLTDSSQQTTKISQTRLRWTDDINEAIIKTYYKITCLEQNKTAYRKQLHTIIIDHSHKFLTYQSNA